MKQTDKISPRRWALGIFLCLLPGLLFLLARALRPLIFELIPYVPKCPFYENFRVYCPGCGNTRSVLALLRGDVLASLHYNLSPVLLLVLGGLWYLEGIFRVFGKRVQLLPRKMWVWIALIGVMTVYFLARNFVPCLAPDDTGAFLHLWGA